MENCRKVNHSFILKKKKKISHLSFSEKWKMVEVQRKQFFIFQKNEKWNDPKTHGWAPEWDLGTSKICWQLLLGCWQHFGFVDRYFALLNLIQVLRLILNKTNSILLGHKIGFRPRRIIDSLIFKRCNGWCWTICFVECVSEKNSWSWLRFVETYTCKCLMFCWVW